MTAITPWMAARQPAQGQIAARGRAMLPEGIERIGGAGGLETTGRAYPGAQGQAVEPHQADEQAAHHGAVSRTAAVAAVVATVVAAGAGDGRGATGADWRRTA